MDLNPVLADTAYGEQSPLPSWSYMRDLKEQYDVSTVLRAAGALSLLYLDRSPKELMTLIRRLSQEAVDDFYQRHLQLQKIYQESWEIPKPRVLSYQELLQECQSRPDFAAVLAQIEQEGQESLKNGASYQEITIGNIQKILDFHDRKEALVIIAIAPPYYPSVNCRRLAESGIDIEKLISLYRDYLADTAGCRLNVEEFFMGICDISYCSLEKPLADYEQLLESMAVPRNLYSIDFPKIAAINVPGINLGPWGKDLHQLTERVFEKDMLETIPNFLLYLLENIAAIRLAER
ncbi:Arginine utilization protein RocB [Streptococcus sp. DD11]|nr:Arginine utilization protein RocB [Streptococcus sp. DD11]